MENSTSVGQNFFFQSTLSLYTSGRTMHMSDMQYKCITAIGMTGKCLQVKVDGFFVVVFFLLKGLL